MQINIKKISKTVVISKNSHIPLTIQVRNMEIEQVTEFWYFWSTITEDGWRLKEIQKRIAMAKEAFNKRGELLRGTLSKELKKRMVKVSVWSVVLYALETRTFRNNDVKRLEACEMWIWRKIENISWSDHITNEQVPMMVGEQRTLMDTIRERRRNWIDHILRKNSLLRTVLEGKLKEEKEDENRGWSCWIWSHSATVNWNQQHKIEQNGTITARTCQFRQRTKEEQNIICIRLMQKRWMWLKMLMFTIIFST